MSIVWYSQTVSYPIGDLATLMEPGFGGASDATPTLGRASASITSLLTSRRTCLLLSSSTFSS
jgi:hypothetical protein